MAGETLGPEAHASSRRVFVEEVGDPVEVIARVADNRGYDLIVMGSRNLVVVKIAQLGSISHGVLCRAHCPALVVR